MTQPKFARIGEKVLVKKPLSFKHVGYPLNPENLLENEELCKELEHKKDFLLKFMEDMKWIPKLRECIPNKIVTKTEFLITSIILERENFGGPVRQIFNYEDEYLKQHIPFVGLVKKKRIVQTGIRMGGRVYQNYLNGEYTYTPPYLDNVVTHCIYTLEIPQEIRNWPLLIDSIYTERAQGVLAL